ncbi:DUF7668 domain-containing protein [Hoeflea poritis]|uniref:DUF7668 domain-containing protein n=1 Tax=Hoeflea poritis TaxID=2993659 RepID=A0ABT4VUH5_9HYPH|nr:hypothetical protein [Hoeflea poritis]MDA4848351.1 hypothetical protein [Hoeflea poritis]
MTSRSQLNGYELSLLRKIVTAIAQGDFTALLGMRNVDCDGSSILSIASTMDEYGATAFALPNENFADRIDVGEFMDGRGLFVEVELLTANGMVDPADYIVLVFEVLRDGTESRVGVHYAYY